MLIKTKQENPSFLARIAMNVRMLNIETTRSTWYTARKHEQHLLFFHYRGDTTYVGNRIKLR